MIFGCIQIESFHYQMEHCYSIDHVKIQCDLDIVTKRRDLAVYALEDIASRPQIGTNGASIWRTAMKALAAIKESET